MKSVNKAFLFGAALLGTLVVIDAYLQLAEIQTPMETRIDPELGPTYIPNKKITRFGEGFFMGSVNEFSYMGPSVPPERRGKERRILLIGDSFVLGHTVLPRHYFGKRIEAKLSTALGEPVYALNFGKADFNIANMYVYYKDYANKFDHDIALFFIGERDLIRADQTISQIYPKVDIRQGEIIINKDFRFSRAFRFYRFIEPIFTRSAVLRLLFNSYKLSAARGWPSLLLQKLPFFSRHNARSTPAVMKKEPPVLPEVYFVILKELSRDPRNILVIHTALPASLRAGITATGIPVIDLGTYLEALKEKGIDPYYWPVTRTIGHWNHTAQKLIGDYLADELISKHAPRLLLGGRNQ